MYTIGLFLQYYQKRMLNKLDFIVILIEYTLDSLTGKIVACHVAEVGSRPTPRVKIRGLA